MMNTKEYMKLHWFHNYSDEPNVIIYEIDLLNDRCIVRLIDIYADGRCINNDDPVENYPMETVEEINTTGEIDGYVERISRKEFEEIWNTHIYHGSF